MKYNQKEMEKRLHALSKVDTKDEETQDKALSEVLELLDSKENMNEFALYVNKMSKEELKLLSLILEELDEECVTKEFVESLRNLINKYKEEDMIEHLECAGKTFELSLIDFCSQSLEYFEDIAK